MTGVDPARNTSAFSIDNSVGAGGKNVVNVILTDFRALDTLGEVTVLAGAAIGVAALVAGLTGRHTGDGDA
jgi:multicomponent K+:H+ antiporter subunit A